MIVAGIDYSITSPAICVADSSKEFSFHTCQFLAVPGNKKLDSQIQNIQIIQNHGKTDDNMSRFNDTSDHAIKFMRSHGVSQVLIEGYAFAAKGLVFNIAENSGLLKYKMWKSNYQVSSITPGELKKLAAGKGNANKDRMFEAFLAETGINMTDYLGLKAKKSLESPVDDIVDAYFLCKEAWRRANA